MAWNVIVLLAEPVPSGLLTPPDLAGDPGALCARSVAFSRLLPNLFPSSRSRAFALSGDYLAEDPRCTYQPHLAETVAG